MSTPQRPSPLNEPPSSGRTADNGAGAPDPRGRRRFALVASIGGAVLAADVATKVWAASVLATEPISLLGGALILTEGRNPGAAFGMGTSLTPLLACIAAAAVIGVLVAARRPRPLGVAVILGLVLGGAAGNVTDRLFRSPGPMRGHVVDWIDIGSWPTFNLADSALVTAAALGALIALRAPTKESHHPRDR